MLFKSSERYVFFQQKVCRDIVPHSKVQFCTEASRLFIIIDIWLHQMATIYSYQCACVYGFLCNFIAVKKVYLLRKQRDSFGLNEIKKI